MSYSSSTNEDHLLLGSRFAKFNLILQFLQLALLLGPERGKGIYFLCYSSTISIVGTSLCLIFPKKSFSWKLNCLIQLTSLIFVGLALGELASFSNYPYSTISKLGISISSITLWYLTWFLIVSRSISELCSKETLPQHSEVQQPSLPVAEARYPTTSHVPLPPPSPSAPPLPPNFPLPLPLPIPLSLPLPFSSSTSHRSRPPTHPPPPLPSTTTTSTLPPPLPLNHHSPPLPYTHYLHPSDIRLATIQSVQTGDEEGVLVAGDGGIPIGSRVEEGGGGGTGGGVTSAEPVLSQYISV